MIKNISVVVGQGRYRVELNAALTGRGINVLLTGGESPHIGAVIMSIPRPSETGSGISSDSWIIPVPGHKEAEVAKALGEFISRRSAQITVVSAGIHLDNAKPEEIKQVCDNCSEAGRKLVEQL